MSIDKSPPDHAQPGFERLILSPPRPGRGAAPKAGTEEEILPLLEPGTVLMMGDNPALPPMPARPALLDFFKNRMTDNTFRHLLASAKRALDAGHAEKTVLACLLHDISNGCFLRPDHGYWGAQMIAPYVDEDVAWAVRYHQALRYFADESVGYPYPDSYLRFFGPDYLPPDYIRRDAEFAKRHRWYMSARLVTLYDEYFFEKTDAMDPDMFAGIVGRHFRQPAEGLGFDGSDVAHMWRTIIWPDNAL
ncbi:MAG TPA: HD domain-containing protein [Steroidobacteraceae bacterium]|nr:HD domain-containing protein [Steroidobacteraceae bacterium]